MKKKAYIVGISPLVRVVVPENATEEEVIDAAIEKMRKDPNEYIHATHCNEVRAERPLEENVKPEKGIVMCNNGVNTVGASFHGVTIRSTVNKLEKALGRPTDGDGGYKVNYEWNIKVAHKGGEFVASVYDWREGRFDRDQEIEFHIGGFNKAEELIAKGYIEKKLAEINEA